MAAQFPRFSTVNDTDNNKHARAINDLITAAGIALRPKKVLNPHNFVIRGDKCEKVGLSEATWHKYLSALFRMGKDHMVPETWKDPILEHMHQITTMAAT